MLRIHSVIIQLAPQIGRLADRIERRDRNLGSQLRRSYASVANNVAEGSAHRGARRRHAYEIALGEARESLSTLQIAAAFGYVAPLPPELRRALNQVVGTLVVVTR
ncbi:MAG: four helix bundle protein [Polyangiaceae bacterium]